MKEIPQLNLREKVQIALGVISGRDEAFLEAWQKMTGEDIGWAWEPPTPDDVREKAEWIIIDAIFRGEET